MECFFNMKQNSFIFILYEISMVLIMSNGQEFNTLIEALKIIHKATDVKVIDALKSYEQDKTITESEIDTIKGWIKPTDPDEDKGRKVARCLVWYIAKINLEINEIKSEEFPYCKCQSTDDT